MSMSATTADAAMQRFAQNAMDDVAEAVVDQMTMSPHMRRVSRTI